MQHDIEQFFIFSKAIEMSFQLIRKIRIYIEITILMFLLRLFCTESLRQTNLCETKKTRGKYMILPRFRGPHCAFWWFKASLRMLHAVCHNILLLGSAKSALPNPLCRVVSHRKIFRFNHTCRNFTRFLISSFPKLIKAHAKSSLYSIICFESACVKLGGLGGTVSFRVGKFSEVFLARFN